MYIVLMEQALRPRARLEAIDQFRGFAIVTMVVANYLDGVQTAPPWLKHAPDVGLTAIDFVAPFFIFAIGLTFGMSARRRAGRDGWRRTAFHFIKRYLAILGIGALGSALSSWYGVPASWGVLQAIGVAGLLTLAAIALPTLWRAAAGLVLLAGYQLLLDRFWLEAVLVAPHGGLPGSLAWGAMMILATVLADLYRPAQRHLGQPHGGERHRAQPGASQPHPAQPHAVQPQASQPQAAQACPGQPRPRKPRWAFPAAAAGTLAVGILLSLLVVVSKHRVSASYVLITLGASGLLYAGFDLLERGRFRIPLLTAWGVNPLLLYILHFLLLGVVFVPDIPALYAQASAWVVVLEIVALLAALSGIAVWLRRRGWIFSF
jgi:predicted acyltransferase